MWIKILDDSLNTGLPKGTVLKVLKKDSTTYLVAKHSITDAGGTHMGYNITWAHGNAVEVPNPKFTPATSLQVCALTERVIVTGCHELTADDLRKLLRMLGCQDLDI